MKQCTQITGSRGKNSRAIDKGRAIYTVDITSGIGNL